MGMANSAPPLTVHWGTRSHTFTPTAQVTVGRNPTCDIVIDDNPEQQRVSREHLVLRVDGDHWVAEDRSRNGVFVDGVRTPRLDIVGESTLNLGAVDGPRLSFELGTGVVRVADLRAGGGRPAAGSPSAPATSGFPAPPNAGPPSGPFAGPRPPA
ncbi:FHA domain-containing protein, partial [Mycolicibacterium brumae]